MGSVAPPRAGVRPLRWERIAAVGGSVEGIALPRAGARYTPSARRGDGGGAGHQRGAAAAPLRSGWPGAVPVPPPARFPPAARGGSVRQAVQVRGPLAGPRRPCGAPTRGAWLRAGEGGLQPAVCGGSGSRRAASVPPRQFAREGRVSCGDLSHTWIGRSPAVLADFCQSSGNVSRI